MTQIYCIGVYTQLHTPIKEFVEGTGFNIKIETKLYDRSKWINYLSGAHTDGWWESHPDKYCIISYLLNQYQIP